MQKYQLTFSNSGDNKYENAVILSKPKKFVCEETSRLNGILFAKFRLLCYFSYSVNILLVYRRNSFNIEEFLEAICYFVIDKNLHIVLGDFNKSDAYNLGGTTLLAQGFNQIVGEATHIYLPKYTFFISN